MKRSFGGVVVNSAGEVLLCKPRNGYGGYVWTFPKGGPDPGEMPHESAVREVREETGWECEVAGDVPGEYAGTTSVTRYFLMRPVRKVGEPGHETEAIRWVSPAGATMLLSETAHDLRGRDLEVLRVSLKRWLASDGAI